MLRRTVVIVSCCAALLAGPALADDTGKAPACCAQKSAMVKAEKAGKLRCTLTGKVVDKCCCEQRDGKTYCTLAKKNVEKCCCEDAETKAEKDLKAAK
jgi:hypothetical protein